jgi:hypothetical protein
MKQLKGQFQLAVFCQDYSTDNPKYFGYYLPGHEFSLPYFTETAVQEIMNDYARMNKDMDNNADLLYWKGKDLLWFDGTDFSLIERITPVKVKVEQQLLTVWPVGHGSWNWERADVSEIIEKLARTFANLIKEELTAEQLNNVNDPLSDINVHDYCDGNQILLNAWEKVMCRDYNFQSDMDHYLSTAAVQMAIDNKHWV